jgi:RNA polymerase sigma-70 factor, ECF subfamily
MDTTVVIHPNHKGFLKMLTTIHSSQCVMEQEVRDPQTGRAEPAAAWQGIEESNVIAARLRADDPSIIDELISAYQLRLRLYLRRLTGNTELTEDLLQETWFRVFTRGAQFRGDARFGTWLFAIARNLAVDRRFRSVWSKSFEEMCERGDGWQMELRCQKPSPFEISADSQHFRLISKALQTLRPEQQRVLELRFFHEMSLLEMAREIQEPLSTVKARFYRALAILRQRVGTPRSELSSTLQAVS